ncbi:MAG: hypothetical protein PVS3B3_18870 [Ktedonobacteraceae bacterium]
MEEMQQEMFSEERIFTAKILVPYALAALGVDWISQWNISSVLVSAVVGYGIYQLTPALYELEQNTHVIKKVKNFVARERGALPKPSTAENDGQPYMLCLGQSLTTRKRLDIHVDKVYGNGIIIAGVQGSGKSFLTGRIMEQIGKTQGPMIIFDHKGEYASLSAIPYLKVLQTGLFDDTLHALKVDEQGEQFDLTVDTVDQFVEKVLTEEYQAVINLPSYGDDWIARAQVVSEVTRVIMRWAAHQKHTDRLPCFVFMDEAQLYLPQDMALLPREARVEEGKEIANDLINSYFKLVSNGRSNGFTVAFATQSLTYIAKAFIKSCNIKIIMKHTENNDLDMCERMISKKIAVREDIENFKPGEAVVFGMGVTQRVKFDGRKSPHHSSTPDYKRLVEVRERRKSSVLAPASRETDRLAENITAKLTKEFTIEEIYAFLQARNQPLPVQVDEEPEPEVDAELQRALDAFEQGHKTIDRLQAKLGMKSREAARKLYTRANMYLEENAAKE